MRIIITIISFFLATAAFAQQYQLQPGDVLTVEVLEDESLNRRVSVLPDGNISFPFAGTLQAEGRTVSQLQNALTSALGPTFATQPTVFVALDSISQPSVPRANKREVTVYFIGEVRAPGRQILPSGTTLLQALASAGGFTEFAATKRIQLRRAGSGGQEKVYTFDYRSASRGAATTGSTVLREGDVILIPERRLFE
ncbi:MAG: polysaccharide export protein [Mangrovicoccus sp.]|nr:polysaccharide export protein [Mangrovicoccus sp.]